MKKSNSLTRAEKYFDTLFLPQKRDMIKKHCGWEGKASFSIKKKHKEKIYREEVLNKGIES